MTIQPHDLLNLAGHILEGGQPKHVLTLIGTEPTHFHKKRWSVRLSNREKIHISPHLRVGFLFFVANPPLLLLLRLPPPLLISSIIHIIITSPSHTHRHTHIPIIYIIITSSSHMYSSQSTSYIHISPTHVYRHS